MIDLGNGKYRPLEEIDSGLNLQELVKETVKEVNAEHCCDPACDDCRVKIQLKSLIEESKKV